MMNHRQHRLAAGRFDSLGDLLVAARNAADMPGAADPRLGALMAVSGMTGGVPADGGFAVPDEYADRVWNKVYDSGNLITRCENVPMSREKIKIPAIGETDRSDGARFGVRMSWTQPGDEITASKPKWAQIELAARKVAGLAYVTDEMWQDVPVLEATMLRLFGLEGAFVIEDEIVNGTGETGPLGILNSGALITVTAESGQTSATITAGNVLAMWSRLWPSSRRSAVWLVNDQCDEQIAQAKLATGSALGSLVTFGDDGMRLLGRPVISTEYNPALGSVGDIVLADLGQYLFGDRETRSETSAHIRFILGEGAFRLILRVDGQPAWSSPVTMKNSGVTTSPFVTLEAR